MNQIQLGGYIYQVYLPWYLYIDVQLFACMIESSRIYTRYRYPSGNQHGVGEPPPRVGLSVGPPVGEVFFITQQVHLVQVTCQYAILRRRCIVVAGSQGHPPNSAWLPLRGVA